MANIVIEPIFATNLDRLLFLSRLYRAVLADASIVGNDETDFETFWNNRPVIKPGSLTEVEWQERLREWREDRVAHPRWWVLSKWRSYRLGKVCPAAEVYLSTRPNPNRTQAREAVRLQLESHKFSDRIEGYSYNLLLIPLVDGLVW